MTDGGDDSGPILTEIEFEIRSKSFHCVHDGDGDGANVTEMEIAQQSAYRDLLEVDYLLY